MNNLQIPSWLLFVDNILNKKNIIMDDAYSMDEIFYITLKKENEQLKIELRVIGESNNYYYRTKKFDITYNGNHLNSIQKWMIELFIEIFKKIEGRTDKKIISNGYKSYYRCNNFYTIEKSIDTHGNEIHEALIRITPECNYNCLFCFSEKINMEPQKNDVINCFENLINKYDNLNIVITGGEPSLSENLYYYLEYLSESDNVLSIQIQSNGYNFSDEERVKKIPKSSKIHFFISIHSTDEKEYFAITGSRGLDNCLQGIKNILNYNYKVILNTVITTLNIESIENFPDWVNNNFSKDRYPVLHFSSLIISDFNHDAGKYLVSYSKISEKLKVIKNKCNKYGTVLSPILSSSHASFPPCTLDESLRDWGENIFQSLELHGEEKITGKDYIKTVKCKKCIYDKQCEGIKKDYFLKYGSSEFKPVIK